MYSYIDRPVGLFPKLLICTSEAADAFGASATRVVRAVAVAVASVAVSAARVRFIAVLFLRARRCGLIRPARADLRMTERCPARRATVVGDSCAVNESGADSEKTGEALRNLHVAL